MSTNFLQRKRKGELLELAQQVKLPDADRLLKDDLVVALSEHLDAHERQYGKLEALTDYYNKRVSSPVKRERTSPAVEDVPVTRRSRRSTLRGVELPVEAEPEVTPEKSASILKRTPRTETKTAPSTAPRSVLASATSTSVARTLPTRTPTAVTPRVTSPLARVAQTSTPSQINLPASPAQVADLTEQTIQTARETASDLWAKTHIMDGIDYCREELSSVLMIQLIVLLLEGGGMQYNTLRTLSVYTNPSTSGLPFKELRIPDLTYLLTEGFWAPATLWSLTNWALPLLISYFVNLTVNSNTRHKSSRRQYTVDPLTFNIARALLVYGAYSLPVADPALAGEAGVKVAYTPGWGPFAGETVDTVRGMVPGSYHGMLISSLIGGLYSVYDAILKK